MSERMWKSVAEYGWKNTRIIQINCKIVNEGWFCFYGYPCQREDNIDGKYKREKFWMELNECLKEFKGERKVI